MKTHLQHAVTAFTAACAIFAAPARAATMSASSTAPVIDGADLANLGDISGSEKWYAGGGVEGPVRGQSFMTGGAAVRLKSITYQVAEGAGAAPTKTYALRVGKVAGNNFTQIHSETATQSISWSSNQYMTWTFSTPVLLEPYTTYAIDVGMTGSTSDWRLGIPYLNMTADEYPGGTSYTSGGNGVGNSYLNIAISSDRIFHIDLENPTGPVFTLVAPSPADNATDAIATRKLVMTFNQTVTPGTGNLTVRNLTDNTQTLIPANDTRLTYDGNVVRLNPVGLIAWSKNYAIRIDSGMFLGDGGAPIAPISDDTTWNFTTLANDPLLAAIAALKGHINNTAPLTLSQIAGHKYTIDNSRQRFPETAQIITAVFDLITTYETLKGPLFVGNSQVTYFDRNDTNTASKYSVTAENYHWAVYSTMQHAMDWIYTAEVLAEHEALLTNYKYASHTNFPGPCPLPTPGASHTVPINGSFPATFGRLTQDWTKAARKPTGTYLSAGTIATVTVPPALVNAGYKIRVGAHSWDLSARVPVKRLERGTRLYDIDATTTKIASPYGGGIYIEVPYLANAGIVNVTINGAVRSPYFSAKSFHQTTPAEWDIEKTHPAPWADYQSEKFMTQVPRKWIFNMNGTQATQLMVDWDKGMDAINDLMGFPRDRGKETMYCQPDVILRSSVHAPGYPATNVITNPNGDVSPIGYAGNYLVRGPGNDPLAANVEFHEQGHAYFFPRFGGESESANNYLQAAMLIRGFDYNHDVAHAASLGNGSPHRTIDNTAVAWMTVFSFSPNEIPMQQAEKAYQHKGHAKFADAARMFGGTGLDNYFKSFMQNVPNVLSDNDDEHLLRLSRYVGKDIRPLFHFWGIHPQNPTALANAIAAENIPSSPEIKAQLLRYKTLVPANNAAFRTFCLNWWGSKPQIAGYWEETDHAMQWDETLDADAGPAFANARPNGSIYVEASAFEIRNRVQELIDLYYPNTIAPGAMSFAILPSSVDATTVGMTAVTATSTAGTIEYYFENITNSTNSGWISTPSWTQPGLTTGLSYAYRVKARDGLSNETSWSPDASVTVGTDTTPPLPTTMNFSTLPYSLSQTSISMTAIAASDINGVEYYFDCTAGGGDDSGWQDSRTYIDTGLTTGVAYTYKVRTRDKSPAQNLGPFSTTASATPTDVTNPTLVSLVPAHLSANVLNSDNLSITFSEAIVRGTGFITLKNLTDATQTQIDITDNTQVSTSGSVLTINPTANLLEGKTYAIRIDATAIDDLASNSYAGITNDTTWSFNVVDLTPPAIVTLSPVDDVTNAPSDSNLVITFSENVTRGTGNITLINLSDVTQSTIAITDNSQVSLSGAVLTINPTADLLIGKSYAIQLANTAITDTATNPFPGISDDITWNFTIVTPPTAAFWLGVTGNWSAPASWVDGITTTGIDFTTNLTGIDITANQTITLDAPRTIGTLNFTDATSSNDATISGANTLTLDRSTGVPTIDVTQADRALTISSVIAGNDGLQKNGPGTLILTGNNPYTGATTINTGTLRLEGSGGGFFSNTNATRNYNINSGATLNLHAASVPVGTANLTGSGTLLLTGGGVSAGNSGRAVNVNLTAGAVIDIPSGSGLYNGGWSAFTWTNNKAILNVNGGLDIVDGNAVTADALTGSTGTITSATNGGSAINFTLGVNNGSGTYSGNITAAGTRVVSLVKNGSGTQTLAGTSTFRGSTTVNGGTLAITGTLSASGVTVANTATLGGNGNITGNVSIASGARHSLAVAATPAAQVTRAITGTLTLTSGNILELTAAATPGPGTYILATATAITGAPTNINYNGILGTVTVDAASTPKRLLLTVTASTYASWITNYPGASSQAGFNQDADGDGVKNGVENFFGTTPVGYTAGLTPGTKTANTFTFTHPQNATPATDITAVYRWSKDLVSFHPSGFTDAANTTVTFTTATNAGITTVTATVTGTPAAKLLVDIKVTQN